MMDFEDIKIQLVDTPPITEEFIAYWHIEIIRNTDLVALVLDLSSDDILDYTDFIIRRLERSNILLRGSGEREISVVGPVLKRTLIIANKTDAQDAHERLSLLKEFYGEKYPIHPISAERRIGLEELKKLIFRELEIIRVYTKAPGKPPDMEDPLILKKGSTILEAAEEIHKDFARKLKYARLWGSSRFPGQRVDKNYILEDKDIVEFHI